MSRRPPSRLPGDPADPDRTFGALGGLVDDVFFWEKSRDRGQELADERLAGEARRSSHRGTESGLVSRTRAALGRLRRGGRRSRP